MLQAVPYFWISPNLSNFVYSFCLAPYLFGEGFFMAIQMNNAVFI